MHCKNPTYNHEKAYDRKEEQKLNKDDGKACEMLTLLWDHLGWKGH